MLGQVKVEPSWALSVPGSRAEPRVPGWKGYQHPISILGGASSSRSHRRRMLAAFCTSGMVRCWASRAGQGTDKPSAAHTYSLKPFVPGHSPDIPRMWRSRCALFGMDLKFAWKLLWTRCLIPTDLVLLPALGSTCSRSLEEVCTSCCESIGCLCNLLATCL